ncbi:MAG TPA: DUF1501 domain-containing protein [Gemmataceae bacterium]|nr:DUF1501 domain-containing protein [Gemmataceae bacterium]
MLSVLAPSIRLCDGLTRREALRVGGLGFTGLMWSDWLRARAAASRPRAGRRSPEHFGTARACILIYNYGGPSHLDVLDLKPDAPQEIRGEFRPVATRVPGVRITEHLPRLAKLANHYAIVRSVHHRDNDHAIGAYLALTGYSHPRSDVLGIEPPASPQDMPSLGSVASRLRPSDRPVFSYITLGDLRHLGNNDSMGQNAGCLGHAYDPFTVPFARPVNGVLDLQGVASVMAELDGRRLGGRKQLLENMDRSAPALEATAGTRNRDGFTKRAFELLSSPATREAFNLAGEPPRMREFYGPTYFAQNCLLARRLVQAGVPLVTVYSVGNRDWDTHAANFPGLKDTLLPPTDRGLSALLEDLQGRGLLEETLVVWMSEMGRTPRINREGGRDHWSFCYSILMAGGGVRGGQVYGSSDRTAAYPSTNPVGPADVAATIYQCLGIDPRAHVTDQQGRPLVISSGNPIRALLG